MAVIDIFTTEEKYDILYTDPPWKQGGAVRRQQDQTPPERPFHTTPWTSPESWRYITS